MIITKMALPRRTFLRGLGATVALPLLDAMVPALSAMAQTAANPVRRLGFVYIPMGMNPAAWTPTVEGQITELSPSLASLMPYPRSAHGAHESRAEERVHHRQPCVVQLRVPQLRAGEANRRHRLPARARRSIRSPPSSIGKATPIPSLELGTDLIAQVGNCDNGYACAYQNNLSWSSPTTPLPTEADPRVVFERLFGDGGKPASAARRAAQERQHSRLGDGRHGPAATGARRRRPHAR